MVVETAVIEVYRPDHSLLAVAHDTIGFAFVETSLNRTSGNDLAPSSK
jgi:hypothetical protein